MALNLPETAIAANAGRRRIPLLILVALVG